MKLGWIAVVALSFLLLSTAKADWYAEVGVGMHHKNDTFNDGNRQHSFTAENPMGNLTVGYNLSWDFRVQYDHFSSLTERDRGVNFLTLKYRFW